MHKNRYVKPEPFLIFMVAKNDVKVKFCDFNSKMRKKHTSPRQSIKQFSYKSRRHLQFTLRNCEIEWQAFLTLTYPSSFPCDGRKVKRDIDLFSASLRRMGIKYVWVLEFQDRGAPHFHFLISGRMDKDYLSRRWFEIVTSEDPKHLTAGTQIKAITFQDGLCGYMTHYLKKLQQKTIPEEFIKIGRFWGASRNLTNITNYNFKFNDKASADKFLLPLVEVNREKLKGWGIEWENNGEGFTAIGAAKTWADILRIPQVIRIKELFRKKGKAK